MKKFFKVLLLAAVALMPVMGMAQTTPSQRDVEQKFVREMRLKQYEDSVAGAKLQANNAHLQKMKEMDNEARIRRINAIWDDDVLIMICIFAAGITVLVLCLRHSRRKAEDHKELINKLIDNNLLNSSEPISKDAIEALMKPKKTEKERFIGDATLLGLGIGLFLGSSAIHGGPEDFLRFAGMILASLGLLRLIIRTITTIIERKNAKRALERKLMEEAVRRQRTETVQEAEIVEEK